MEPLYDIILVGFPSGVRDGVAPSDAIRRVFKVDADLATRLVGHLPAVVRRGATALEARKYFNALTWLGAQVEMRASDAQGSGIAPAAGAPDRPRLGPNTAHGQPGEGANERERPQTLASFAPAAALDELVAAREAVLAARSDEAAVPAVAHGAPVLGSGSDEMRWPERPTTAVSEGLGAAAALTAVAVGLPSARRDAMPGGDEAVQPPTVSLPALPAGGDWRGSEAQRDLLAEPRSSLAFGDTHVSPVDTPPVPSRPAGGATVSEAARSMVGGPTIMEPIPPGASALGAPPAPDWLEAIGVQPAHDAGTRAQVAGGDTVSTTREVPRVQATMSAEGERYPHLPFHVGHTAPVQPLPGSLPSSDAELPAGPSAHPTAGPVPGRTSPREEGGASLSELADELPDLDPGVSAPGLSGVGSPSLPVRGSPGDSIPDLSHFGLDLSPVGGVPAVRPEQEKRPAQAGPPVAASRAPSGGGGLDLPDLSSMDFSGSEPGFQFGAVMNSDGAVEVSSRGRVHKPTVNQVLEESSVARIARSHLAQSQGAGGRPGEVPARIGVGGQEDPASWLAPAHAGLESELSGGSAPSGSGAELRPRIEIFELPPPDPNEVPQQAASPLFGLPRARPAQLADPRIAGAGAGLRGDGVPAGRGSGRTPPGGSPRAAGGTPPGGNPIAGRGATPAGGSPIARRAGATPGSVAAVGTGPAYGVPIAVSRRPEELDDGNKDFYSAIPDALLLPFRGPGVRWLVSIILLTFCVGGLSALAGIMPLVGMALNLVATAGLLALTVRFFHACLWATSHREPEPNTMPEIIHFQSEYIFPGLALAIYTAVAYVPLAMWFSHLLETGFTPAQSLRHPVTLLLFVFPFFYWPMGLTLTAATDSFLSLWNFPKGIAAIFRAPLKYTVVVVIGVLAAALPLVLAALAIMGASNLLGPIVALVFALMPVAYSHGVMGALMGRLIRQYPEMVQ